MERPLRALRRKDGQVQAAFSYMDLVIENRRRGFLDFEYEDGLLHTKSLILLDFPPLTEIVVRTTLKLARNC